MSYLCMVYSNTVLHYFLARPCSKLLYTIFFWKYIHNWSGPWNVFSRTNNNLYKITFTFIHMYSQCSGKIYFYGIYLNNTKYISRIYYAFPPLRDHTNIFLFENRWNIFKIYFKNILYFLLSILGKSAIGYTFKMRFRSSIQVDYT